MSISEREELLSYFKQDEETLGWAYPLEEPFDENDYWSPRPNNAFYRDIEFAYVVGMDKESDRHNYEDDVYHLNGILCSLHPLFMGCEFGNSFWVISYRIIERFDRESIAINKNQAHQNLNKSLKVTLETLFWYLDKHNIGKNEDELYSKFLTSYLTLRMFDIEQDHLLYKFKLDVLEELLIRKEMFQEIVTFNKVSKGVKLSYESFKVQLDEDAKRNFEKKKTKLNHFSDFWLDKNKITMVLDSFIEKYPNEKYLDKTAEGYIYIINPKNNGNIKLAGLFVALCKAGWIDIDFRVHSAPICISLLGDFFGIKITDKTPFTTGPLIKLMDENQNDYKKYVKPLLPFIPVR